jgi:hypothetical protein
MKKWYCSINGQTYGPYDENQLRKKAENGSLTPDSFVWNDNIANPERIWVRAEDSEIKTVFKKKEPSRESEKQFDPPNSPREASGRGMVEEENMNDIKKMMLKILHTIFKESKFREFYIFFGVLLLIGLMAKHMVLVIGLIVLYILYRITAMFLHHRRLKRQQDIEILNADINRMDGDEAERRAEKYQDK